MTYSMTLNFTLFKNVQLRFIFTLQKTPIANVLIQTGQIQITVHAITSKYIVHDWRIYTL